MFNRKFTAALGSAALLGGLGVAALVTAGAASAAPTITPFSVTVTPNPVNITGQEGTTITPVTLVTMLGPGLSGASAPAYSVTSGVLPAGVGVGPSSGIIGGTPTVSGSGSAIVTASVSQSVKLEDGRLDVRYLASNCSYSVSGGPVVTTDGTWSDFAITKDGQITGTVIDGDETLMNQTPPDDVLNALSFMLTCSGDTDVVWNLTAAPVPTPTVTVTPPTVVNVPTGGVQTGGGKSAPASPWLPVGLALSGGLIALGGVAEATRRLRKSEV
jgi:hypothetical protein